jgi:hypothetical protein
MYPSGIHAPYPYHYGMNMCSPYEMMDPLPMPDIHACAPPYYYPYRRGGMPYADYPCYDYIPRPPPPPMIQTNVRNDVSYYVDDPYEAYESPYRLSHPRVQLVDVVPKNRPVRNSNRMVVSTFQPRERRETERVLAPRTTAVPVSDRQRRTRLVPMYHSADPQYAVPSRRRSVVREIIPLATMANSNDHRQTIRVRSLSPL